MRFRFVPKFMTFDDLERLIRTLAEKMHFTEPTRKKLNEDIEPYYQSGIMQINDSSLISRNVSYMRILEGVHLEMVVKGQWG